MKCLWFWWCLFYVAMHAGLFFMWVGFVTVLKAVF